ncbi:MAG: hypothetical protein ACFFAU_21490, partial [Candidatus Hodarchaeota archaeon]
MPNAISTYRNELIEKYITPHKDQIERTDDIVNRVFLEKLVLVIFLALFTIVANSRLFPNQEFQDYITLFATLGLDAATIKVKWTDFRDLYIFKFRSMTKLNRTSDIYMALLSGLEEEGIRRTNTVKKLQKYSAFSRKISTLEPWLDKDFPKKVDELFS